MERLRAIVASYWTALALGIAATVLHVRWYTVDKAPGAEVVSGFGAALVVLGLLVAARPFIRTGVRGMAEQTIHRSQWQGYVDAAGTMISDAQAADQTKVKAAIPDVWAERVVAVAVVILGTLLNGYGPLIARALHLRAS